MTRRNFAQSLLAGAAATPAALRGLPRLTIKDAKIISTSGGSNYRWIFLKLITSEPKDPDQIEDLWQTSHLRTYWRNGRDTISVCSIRA